MHLHHAETATTHEVYHLKSGSAGVMQTARLMRELVGIYKMDPIIRNLALGLVQFHNEKDDIAEISAIFHFVRDQIRYVRDIYGVETLAIPTKTLELGQGDCDDKAVLLASLLEAIGYHTQFKLAGYHGKEFEHVYVYAAGNEIELHLDPTEPEDMGWEAPNPTISLYVGD